MYREILGREINIGDYIWVDSLYSVELDDKRNTQFMYPSVLKCVGNSKFEDLIGNCFHSNSDDYVFKLNLNDNEVTSLHNCIYYDNTDNTNSELLNRPLKNGDLVIFSSCSLDFKYTNYAIYVGDGEYFNGYCILKDALISIFKVEHMSDDEKIIYNHLNLKYGFYISSRLKYNKLNKNFGDVFLYTNTNGDIIYLYLYSDKNYDYFYSFSLTLLFDILYDIGENLDIIDLFYPWFHKDVNLIMITKNSYKKRINSDTYLGRLFFCNYFSVDNYFKYIDSFKKSYLRTRASLKNISVDKNDLKKRRINLIKKYDKLIKEVVFSLKNNDFSKLNKSSIDLLFKYIISGETCNGRAE